MSDFISAITNSTTGLTSATLWADVSAIVPLLMIVIPFVFALTILRRVIKGTAKGKVRF